MQSNKKVKYTSSNISSSTYNEGMAETDINKFYKFPVQDQRGIFCLISESREVYFPKQLIVHPINTNSRKIIFGV